MRASGCGCQNRFGIPFWLVGDFTTHFRTYFSGDWDVYWAYGILTHGQVGLACGHIYKHRMQWLHTHASSSSQAPKKTPSFVWLTCSFWTFYGSGIVGMHRFTWAGCTLSAAFKLLRVPSAVFCMCVHRIICKIAREATGSVRR